MCLSEISDIELVRELVRRLKLSPAEDNYVGMDRFYDGVVKYPEYKPSVTHEIIIGAGDGHMGFFVEFNFIGDKFVSHGVWE